MNIVLLGGITRERLNHSAINEMILLDYIMINTNLTFDWAIDVYCI